MSENQRQTMIPRDATDKTPLSQAAISANAQFVQARLQSLADEMFQLLKNSQDWTSALPGGPSWLANPLSITLPVGQEMTLKFDGILSEVSVKYSSDGVSGFIQTPTPARGTNVVRKTYFSSSTK